MNVSSVAIATTPLPMPRELMMAIAAARPAALAQQAVAASAVGRGTSGQGTPALDAGAAVDFYA